MLTTEEFDLSKSQQYCDNINCSYYNRSNKGNIKINGRPKGQVYRNQCGNCCVLTKGTVFFGLRTPMYKAIKVPLCPTRSMRVNNTCAQEAVTADPISVWIEKAAQHAHGFTEYMQRQMHLEQV